MYVKNAGWVANSVDPDQTPRSAASDLDLYCLLGLGPVCPNTTGYNDISRKYSAITISTLPWFTKIK